MRSLIVWGVAASGLAAVLLAQKSPTTTLVVRIAPESLWNPAQMTLNFRVSADGAGDFTNQAQTVSARVRAATGQAIHLTATAGAISGPTGVLDPSALHWSGARSEGVAGGQQAACTSGSFAGGPTQDLAEAWTRSGVLACDVSFSLANPRTLASGQYSAVVTFKAAAQ